MSKQKRFSQIAAVLAPLVGNAAAAGQSFDSDWRFFRGDIKGAEQSVYDDSDWRVVDTPHDWSIEDLVSSPAENPASEGLEKGGPFDKKASPGKGSTGWTVGGIGWYRKHFKLPDLAADQRVEVRFDGVYMNCDVWLNGEHVTNHPFGYTPFACDLTPHLKRGDENVLAVRVRNEGKTSRWYSGSGIYRKVTLATTGSVFVPAGGLCVTTPKITEKRALVRVEVEVANALPLPCKASIDVQILDPEGKVVGKGGGELTLSANEIASSSVECAIAGPQLWDVDRPALYRAVAEVRNSGKVSDKVESHFGIRTIEVDAEHGLRLNGKALKLRGGCMHHDNGMLGAVAIPRAEERRVALMKAAGYNAIRSSHNPPSTAFLDACDRLGMLVIDEAFDCWERKKNPADYSLYFDAWAERDIAAMVRRDRNHPSVVMWSIGNEIPERFSRPDIAGRLRKAVLAHDTTRPLTVGVNASDNDYPPGTVWETGSDPAFVHVEVAGLNYLCRKYENDHQRQPARVMVGTESYPAKALENWDLVDKLPFVVGDFVWTGFDYLGESGVGRSWIKDVEPAGMGPWPWHIAYCGEIDFLGRRTPWSYFRESLWTPGVVRVAVHRPLPEGQKLEALPWALPEVYSHWNWPGQEGKPLKVDVYSSCEKVALTLNGKLIGEKPTSRSTGNVATFDVPYKAGELKAVGTVNGKTVEHVLRTASAPAALRLTADRKAISASRDDLSFVDIEVVDAAGVVDPQAEVPVQISLEGPAELAAVGNANPVDITGYRNPLQKTWRGSMQAIVRPKGVSGVVKITAQAEGLPACHFEILVDAKL